MPLQTRRPPVLIVEDYRDIAETLSLLLQMQGCEPLCAPCRDEALQLVETRFPGVVIMDYMMSGMSAEDFIARVRAHCPACKIVLMSGAAETPQIAERLKVDMFFVKPADVDKIVEYVAMLQK